MSGSVGFSVRASFPELDEKKFIKAVKDACRQALLKAARKFLLAALPRVPIFTGFARGAFGNLEDLVGRFTPAGGGGKIETKKKGLSRAQNFAKRTYYYYPSKGNRIIRNTISGRPFATKTADILSQGRAKIATGESAIFFRFSIDISYFNYLDRSKWDAFGQGTTAFNTELKTQLERLVPKIGKFLIRKDIK